MHQVLIIGVGNEFRGDDAAGLVVARHLQERLPEVVVRESPGEGATLMETWKDGAQVFLIDAVSSGSPAGTIHRLEAHTGPLPTTFFRYSTHAFGVAEAIEMARVLGQLPPRLIVYGIEGANYEAGVELSPEVSQAVAQVVARVVGEVVGAH